MTSFNDLTARLNNANQSHLLQFWDDLNNEEKAKFAEHLGTINFEEVNEIFVNSQRTTAGEDGQNLDGRMKPIPAAQFESEERSTPEQLDYYKRVGLEEISKGHVGVLLLAGGQGTRLGVDYPKGMYSIGLPSGKTLFQVQAERIRKVEEMAKIRTGRTGRITWYIMTSGPTEEATSEYLERNDYFGLQPENVVQFGQGLLPCFDMQGRILLEDKNKVALAPDGNGGTFRALKANKILDDMKKRGVLYVHVHSVDNILIKVADPVFVGYCVDKNADCGAKVVKKSNPSEAVGVVCQVDDRFQVVEYSEISDRNANLRDQNGDLIFSAGNICNHFFSTDFLIEVADKYEKQLKLHVAKKKIAFVNEAGVTIKPSEINGIKIEKFVFDVFQFSNRFVTWEVPRHTEFSPLKNKDDAKKDCATTAREDLFYLHKKYVEDAGGTVEGKVVEISPLLSYAGENLKSLVKGKSFKAPLHLDLESKIINGHL